MAQGAVPIIRWYDSIGGWDTAQAEYGYKHYLRPESAPQQEAVGDGLEFAEWVGIHCSFVVTSEGKEGWETDTDDGFFDIQQLYSLFKQSK